MAPASRPACGNPLWLTWLEGPSTFSFSVYCKTMKQNTRADRSVELRDAAREKGMKSAEAYSKACRSLSLCPVTYHRPRELTVLQGIGAKTAQILEVKWATYCKDNGLPSPGEISPTSKSAKGAFCYFDQGDKD